MRARTEHVLPWTGIEPLRGEPRDPPTSYPLISANDYTRVTPVNDARSCEDARCANGAIEMRLTFETHQNSSGVTVTYAVKTLASKRRNTTRAMRPIERHRDSRRRSLGASDFSLPFVPHQRTTGNVQTVAREVRIRCAARLGFDSLDRERLHQTSAPSFLYVGNGSLPPLQFPRSSALTNDEGTSLAHDE